MKFKLPRLIISLATLLLWLLLYISTLEPHLNRKQAFKDIMTNHVKFVHFGMGGATKEVEAINRKYGFKDYNLGCLIYKDKRIEEYQTIIDAYLKWRNGLNWKEKYYKELEVLYNYQDSAYKNQQQKP